jgi:cytochrome b561
MQARQGARYSGVAMLLHWVIAIAVIVNWRLAESAHEGPREAAGALMSTHKAIGMTILLLTVLRLIWRLAHPSVVRTPNLKPWERVLAKTVHVTFYVLLLGLPLLGWVASSSFGKSIDWFGVFQIPTLPVAHNEHAGETLFDIHHTLGGAMVWLIALHVAGALKHTVIDRDGTLWRMLPFGTPRA